MHHSRTLRHRAPRRSQTGMTLIEIIIVIVLIGGVLAVVGNSLINNKARADHRLAGNIQMLPGPPDLFLTVKRQVVAILSNNDGRQQTRRGQGTFLQKMKRGDDRGLERMIAPDIFAADQAAP